MLSKFSKEQLARLTLHTVGINNVLLEALLPSSSPLSDEPYVPEADSDLEIFVTGMSFEEVCKLENRPQTRSVITDFNDLERSQREQALSRLCGRWIAGNNRCGVDISRAGEHFVLTYLKRNGHPSDERYILMWLDGDILYYGREDRLTVLALNTQTDTLMISPGADYTRIPKAERE